MRVTRSVLEYTVKQCVNTVKVLHADVAKLHCRMLVAERMLKDKLQLTEDDVNATVEAMIQEETEKKDVSPDLEPVASQ